jgi:hypothetical protein
VAFSPPQNLSNNPAPCCASDQQIAVDSSGRMYIVWSQDSGGVLFSRSLDGGKTFSSPQNLASSVSGSRLPEIAVDPAGNINVIWTSGSVQGVWLSRSTDTGATFSAPKAIANGVCRCFPATSVATDSAGNIYFSWIDNASPPNLFFSRSLDQGATFSAPIQLSNSTNSQLGIWALGLGTNGNVDLVWSECNSQCTIWFNQSKDSGATFSSPKMLARALDLDHISLVLDSTGVIYVAYNTVPKQIPGQPVPIGDVFLASSKDGGNTFSTTNLTNNPNPQAFSCCAQVAVDSGGNVDLVWVDPEPVIKFARSTDGGSTFSRTTVPAGTSSEVGFPQIALDSKGGINVIWTAPNDVFYSRSTDNGTTFSSPQNLSNDNETNQGPGVDGLALDPCGNVNVIWQDFSPGPTSIFFSRGTTPASIASGCVTHPGNAIARAQSADAYTGNTVTLSKTSAGNFLIVAASWADLTSDPTISDSAMNTWNVLPVLRGPAGQAELSIKLFYATNIKGGDTTITLSSSPFDVGIHAVEYSGVATSNALDVMSTALADGGTTTPTSGSFTPTDVDLVYAYFGDEGTAQSAITAGPGYSMITMIGDHVDASQENLASSGTQTASFTLGATTYSWALYVATFKPSAGQR